MADRRADPKTHGVVRGLSLLFLLVSSLACLFLARRDKRVYLMIALRNTGIARLVWAEHHTRAFMK